MIPYLLGLVGAYLIGDSRESKSFADGGITSMDNRIKYQIKKSDGTYFYVKMSTGSPAWIKSPDMAYSYSEEDAEKIKVQLEKEGFTGLSIVKYDKDWWKNAPDEFADGGSTDTIATIILKQLGGAGRLNAMTGAYNFRDLGNGLSFKIKNQRANYIKITLNGMDLYDLEVGRTRGTTYKVVASHDSIYYDQLKPLIEKATGMYLSLFAKGGGVNSNSFVKAGDSTPVKMTDAEYEKFNQLSKKQKENVKSFIWLGDTPKSALDKINKKKKYAVLRSPMGEIIADTQVDNEDKMEALKKFRDMGINEVGTIYFTDNAPHYYAKGGKVGDAARVKSRNKTGVILKVFKADDFEQFSDIKPEKNYLITFVDGSKDTYPESELEFYKN